MNELLAVSFSFLSYILEIIFLEIHSLWRTAWLKGMCFMAIWYKTVYIANSNYEGFFIFPFYSEQLSCIVKICVRASELSSLCKHSLSTAVRRALAGTAYLRLLTITLALCQRGPSTLLLTIHMICLHHRAPDLPLTPPPLPCPP